MSEFDQQPWLGEIRAWLDDSAQALDAATVSRLNRARHAAVARRRHRPRRIWWLPAAAVACSGALLLAVTLWPQHAPQRAAAPAPAVATAAGGDIGDALSSDESIEFYQNLDFYAWLDTQDLERDG